MKYIFFLIFTVTLSVSSYSQTRDINNLADSTRERLAFELAQIFAFDQGIRDFHILKNYYGELTKIMPAIDSINFEKFVAFIKEYGYPTKSLLGEYFKYESVRMADVVMLLHNPRRLVKDSEIYQLFKNEVEKGRLSASLFAEALDKYYVFYEGKSLYNSQFKKSPKLAVKGVLITDKHLSDSLRMDIGLPPLAEDEFIYENK